MGRQGVGSVWVVLALCACGDNSSPGVRPDGGGSPDGGGVDAAPQADAGLPRTVRGSQIDLHVTDTGEEMAPIDLSSAVIEALIDDGAGGYLRLPGVGTADGTFTIEDVPAGAYLLRVNDRYLVTDRDMVDLGRSRLGRAGAATATISPTRLVWRVDQMAAWQVDDRLDFFAPNAGASYLQMEDEARNPPIESDAAIAMSVDHTKALEPKLVDASAGDIGYLLHLSMRGAEQSLKLTQLFEPAAFTMIDGQRTILSGSFSDVALDRTVELDLRSSSFTALVDRLSAGPVFQQDVTFDILTSPFSIDRGDLGFITLAEYAAPDLTDRQVTIDYGHPFPADWTPYESFFYGAFCRIDDDPFTVALGALVDFDVAGGLSGGPITPRLGPVENPTINGMDATQPIANAGTTPVLAWQPPTLGTAELYRVLLRRVAPPSPVGAQIAVFMTPGTTLRIPDGLLAPGDSYFFEIDALAAPDADLLAAPFRASGPRRSMARRPTSVMTAP